MTYLNFDRLKEFDPQAFQTTKPYPWINPAGLLTEEGYGRLLETLPDVSLFDASFGETRSHGQSSALEGIRRGAAQQHLPEIHSQDDGERPLHHELPLALRAGRLLRIAPL
jgi:hypothetical protein